MNMYHANYFHTVLILTKDSVAKSNNLNKLSFDWSEATSDPACGTDPLCESYCWTRTLD